jgi:hypothetical protein
LETVSERSQQSRIACDLALNRGTINRETINCGIAPSKEAGLLRFQERERSSVRKPRPSRQVLVSVGQKVWSLRDREEGICCQKIA